MAVESLTAGAVTDGSPPRAGATRAERRLAPAGVFAVVPSELARHDVEIGFAAELLRIPADLLGRLAEETLTGRADEGDAPRYDYVDLVNLATYSGYGASAPELAMRFQVKFASEAPPAWYVAKDWQVTVRPPAGSPGVFTLAEPDLEAPGVAALGPGVEPLPDGEGYRARVRLTGAPATVRDPMALRIWQDMLAELFAGAVAYQTVPEVLRADAERAWELGMADCIVAAQVLAARLRAAGLGARARRGYLLGLVGSEHAWCELWEDDEWKCLDPVFAFAAAGGRGDRTYLNSPRFAEACLGSRFNRLLPCTVPKAGPLVLAGSGPTRAWQAALVATAPVRAAAEPAR